MSNYICFTDGAFSSNRNQGGVGIIILKDDIPILEYSKMFKNTTNNKMELIAIIIALRTIKTTINSIVVYSDSMYCIGCITLNWKRKKNQDLWKIFDSELDRVKQLCNNIEFIHVKGHSNNKYNNLCDLLAVKASQQI